MHKADQENPKSLCKDPLSIGSTFSLLARVSSAAKRHLAVRCRTGHSSGTVAASYRTVGPDLVRLKKQREQRAEGWRSQRRSEVQAEIALSLAQDQRAATKRLDVVHDIVRQLKRRRVRTERKDEGVEGPSFNIITNEAVDYFSLTNYGQQRHFKKVNDTIDELPHNAKLLIKSTSVAGKYKYSGMQQQQLFNYSDKLRPETRDLYIPFSATRVAWTLSTDTTSSTDSLTSCACNSFETYRRPRA